MDLAKASCDLAELSRIQPDAFRKRQMERRWAIVRHHYESNPLYRGLVGKKLPSEWENLPVITKQHFQQKELRDLTTAGFPRRNLYIGSTSGSSGQPFVFAKDKDCHARTWALIRDRYSWFRISLSSRQARFYGIPRELLPSLCETLKDAMFHRVRFPVFDLSPTVLSKFVERFRRKRFEYIYGYTNSLVAFAHFLLKSGICLVEICPTLRLCIATSETCTSQDCTIMEKAFGTNVVREYGASEVGVIAFENAAGDFIVSDENLYLEIVDERNNPVAPGTHGTILVTDLYNKAFPFLRYKIGDLGALASGGQAGPDPRSMLLALLGRVNDTITLPSGRVSPGLTFYYVSRSILESSGALREFIIRQTAVDCFVFDVVSDRDLTPSEVGTIQQKTAEYLEPGLRVIINRVPEIKRHQSGKMKHFFSELS